ncbi:FRG domain-containing protein [Kaistia sp. MMO-174]|uniref:FRG domain-containing protein n=1 Tax=Kaistia sp. MMO-174 TaxID=3081256 RepID=UPI00301B1512
MDGLIPSCKIASWRDLERVVSQDPHTSNIGQVIYRGHRRHDWQLEPGLTRAFSGGAIPPNWSAGLLRKFSLSMRGRGFDFGGRDDNEIWAIGQHFGLATPLLDWTESAFVALFFAFADEDRPEELSNPSRAIYCLQRSALDELLPDLFFEPRLGENSRLVNQAGLFTVTAAGGDNPVTEVINALSEAGAINPDDPRELSKFICKIHIPNTERPACLGMLRKMNIHHANLFPDPGGASSYCNDWLNRAVAEERQLQAARKLARAKAETQASREVGVPSHGAGAEQAIADLLGQLGDLDRTGIIDVETTAARIQERYQIVAGIDWWAHPTGRARLKVDLKRLLASIDWPESSRDILAERLVEIYAERDERSARLQQGGGES